MKLFKKLASIITLIVCFLVLAAAILFLHSDIPLDELKARYAEPPSTFLSVNGMNVHYRDQGHNSTTPPIVLLHGTGASLHTFEGWTKRLHDEYRVITLDLPGYGLTGPFPDRDYSIENYVSFLNDFFNELGVNEFILGGNSLGGHIAWRYTVKYTDQVGGLILINSAGYPYKSESKPAAFHLAETPVIKHLFKYITPRFVVEQSVENIYSNRELVTDSLVDRYFELSLRPGNRQAFIDRMEIETSPTAYLQIQTIQQPTLILWGEDDRLIPLEIAYRFHEELPDSRLVMIPETGHIPMEESPERSLSYVLSFLADLY